MRNHLLLLVLGDDLLLFAVQAAVGAPAMISIEAGQVYVNGVVAGQVN